MTVRELYDNTLIELNKVEAPSLLLEDFVYFANKAVQQYINKVYNRYEIDQQATDDLRVLKKTKRVQILSSNNSFHAPGEDNIWCCELPDDYLHILNCIVTFNKNGSDNKCENRTSSEITSMARRLTSDMYPSILRNAYFKPSYKNPYYFITNRAEDLEFMEDSLASILDPCGIYGDKIDGLEIRCGSTTKYYPTYAFIDYLRIPTPIALEYEQLELDGDTTDDLEFPEYVCFEIINELVKLILENTENGRLQTNTPINQTITGVSNNN